MHRRHVHSHRNSLVRQHRLKPLALMLPSSHRDHAQRAKQSKSITARTQRKTPTSHLERAQELSRRRQSFLRQIRRKTRRILSQVQLERSGHSQLLEQLGLHSNRVSSRHDNKNKKHEASSHVHQPMLDRDGRSGTLRRNDLRHHVVVVVVVSFVVFVVVAVVVELQQRGLVTQKHEHNSTRLLRGKILLFEGNVNCAQVIARVSSTSHSSRVHETTPRRCLLLF